MHLLPFKDKGEQREAEGKRKGNQADSCCHRVVGTAEAGFIHHVHQRCGRPGRTALGDDDHGAGGHHGQNHVGAEHIEHGGRDHRQLDLEEADKEIRAVQVSSFRNVLRDRPESRLEQQEVEADTHPNRQNQTGVQRGIPAFKPTQLQAEEGIDKAQGGAEHGLEDHTGCGHGDRHGQREHGLGDGAQAALLGGQPGQQNGDQQRGRHIDDCDHQRVFQSSLEVPTTEDILIVVKTDEPNDLTSLVDSAQAVDDGLNKRIIDKQDREDDNGGQESNDLQGSLKLQLAGHFCFIRTRSTEFCLIGCTYQCSYLLA